MLLELQNLGKSFGEHEVLHDVTAGVERGDRIGIIAPTAPARQRSCASCAARACLMRGMRRSALV